MPFLRNNKALEDLIVGDRQFLKQLDYVTLRKLCKTVVQSRKVVDAILENLKKDKSEQTYHWAASALAQIASRSQIGKCLIKHRQIELNTLLGAFLENAKFNLKHPYSKLRTLIWDMSLEQQMGNLSLKEKSPTIARNRSFSMPTSHPRLQQTENEDIGDETQSDQISEKELKAFRHRSLPFSQSYSNLPQLTIDEDDLFSAADSYTPIRDRKKASFDVFQQGNSSITQDPNYDNAPEQPREKRSNNVFYRLYRWCS